MSAHAAIVDGRAENDDESVTSPLSAQLLEKGGGGGSEKQKHAEGDRRRPTTAENTQNTTGASYWQKRGYTPSRGVPGHLLYHLGLPPRMFCYSQKKSLRHIHAH
ncbi:hypothetical protein GOODEAATRI_018320 [Goodea atripinnis]|uniref:Uncharacterized protein n=1 Tax=Goodea atripinnis TaxID=208336 RepID=A0ABV0NBK6_9TELE